MRISSRLLSVAPTRRPAGRAAPIALAASLVMSLAGCEETTSALGPEGATFVATTGTAVTVGGQTGVALLGRWTRVDASTPGVLVETTFTFLDGGRGARSVVTRSALGAAIAEGIEPFSWTGGGGVLILRFAGPLGETVVRASFAVETELTGTTLRLDGRAYRRAGS